MHMCKHYFTSHAQFIEQTASVHLKLETYFLANANMPN